MSITFARLVQIYKRIDFAEKSLTGELLLGDQSDCDFLHDLLNDQDEYGISIESGSVAPFEKIKLNLSSPRTGFGLLLLDVTDLLAAHKRQIKEPEKYFIVESKFFNLDKLIPAEIIHYRAIIRLVDLLRKGADYISGNEFIFFNTDIFKLTIRYHASTLRCINRDSLNTLLNCFNDDVHQAHKLAIVVKNMQAISVSIANDAIFDYVLQRIDVLKEQYDKGYRLFVSEFSYDKVMDQLRTAQIEEMGKIHKTFSDIQNHVLGIPVATLIVATQMKKTSIWNEQAIINSVILFGCIIFVCLVALVLMNQLQTLKAIRGELERKRRQIEEKYSLIEEDVADIFSSIGRRIVIQKSAFYLIGFFLGVGLLATLFIYHYLTPATWQFFLSLLHCAGS